MMTITIAMRWRFWY